jgi:hypothetical protein
MVAAAAAASSSDRIVLSGDDVTDYVLLPSDTTSGKKSVQRIAKLGPGKFLSPSISFSPSPSHSLTQTSSRTSSLFLPSFL